MKLTPAELKALVEFLEGLTELTARTGVMACAYDRDFVELPGGQTVQINSGRDGDGRVTYAMDGDS